MSSDRVTWEVCPACGRSAAVGWIDDSLAEFDCTAGCTPQLSQIRELSDRRSRTLDWLTRP